MHRVSTPDVRDTSLRQTEEPYLSLGDELSNGAGHVLHRHRRVDAVLVQQVDMVRLETPQRPLDCPPDGIGTAVNADRLPVLDAEAELCGEDHPVASPLESAANQLLVGPGTVDLGGVQEGASKLDRAMNGGDGLALVALAGRAVRRAHPHTAEADGTDVQTAVSECSL